MPGPESSGTDVSCRTTKHMDRSQLIIKLTVAATPNDIATAISDARYWLAENPEDEAVRNGIQQLARLERERLS
jgi:hypothetical protein